MAISQIKLKNGNVADIHAKAFSGTRKINISGDVFGSNDAWNGKDECDISVTIGDNKVSESKLATDSVTTQKVKDSAITLPKIASSAFGNSDVASDNDGHIASHAQVVSYVTRILSGYGQNYGVMTVAAINAMTLENLHNGDLVSVTGISDKSPANVITLGNITVRNGSNLIFHKSGSGASVTGVWQLMDGEFKLTQSALEFTCDSAKTLAKISQNENGDISVSFQDIQSASATKKGLMSPEDYSKLAALPTNDSLNTSLGKKADKVTGSTEGNLASLDANGNLKDSGFNPSDFVSSESAGKTDEVVAAALGELEKRLMGVEDRKISGDIVVDSVNMQEFPLVGGKSMVMFGASDPSVIPDYDGQLFVDTTNKVVYVATGSSSPNDWSALKKRQTAISGGQGSTKKTLTGIAQDADGKITPVFENIAGLSDNNYSDAEKQNVANSVVHIDNGDIHVTKSQKDSWTGKQDKLTNTDAQIQDAVLKAHEHSNKSELDKVKTGDVDKWNNKAENFEWMTSDEAVALWNAAWNAAT